ncbi:calpain-like cysteine peptidase [Trypanosoma rangeli]|uniref:Calpain-like cysteine peptidase n=1 Tax=Trypanosoma rangeli TaxID=5698 RepID=A0A422N021_TRYRA|nr:calpain-like cysteine peptidase [Trypanosoma rangeli]RNE98822.1 calpain-like cysteine peptidase [Trypanosoma rangeli]|eukprot:RNE98822.1 calpain-like cysteine peptidase [Trypanosoma rangeli]
MARRSGSAARLTSLEVASAKHHSGSRRSLERDGGAKCHSEQVVRLPTPQKGVIDTTKSDSKSGNGGGVFSTGSEYPNTLRQEPLAGGLLPEGRGGAVAAMANDLPSFTGPGPSNKIHYDKIFSCFAAGNGLLFRLVDERHHTWAYYNDTASYTMHVTVTFGRESTVEALGAAVCTVTNAASGRCRIDLLLPPGRTELFMHGEYNGFSSHYEVVPPHMAPTQTRKGNSRERESGEKSR